MALSFAVAAHPHWRSRLHFALVGSLIAFASLVPLGLWTASGAHPLNLDATGDLLMVMGVGLCVLGLLDRRALRKEHERTGGAGAA